MQRFLVTVALAVWLGLLAAPGCRLLEDRPKGRSPLAPLQVAEDSVALEIFFARFDYGLPSLSENLWQQIDEQILSTDVRRELARYGFRVGLVGSQVPVELARLLTLTDTPPPQGPGNTVDLENEPLVKLRVLEIRSGRRGEIIASPVYDRLPLLWREGDKVQGRPYEMADGRLALKATRHGDGRVGLDLLPELHYGKSEQQWIANDGMFQLTNAQKKRAFNQLHMKLDLAPGQMLVMTCRPDHPGSVGHYFFSEPVGEEGLAQRLLVVRLASAGSDRAFSEIVSAEVDPATGKLETESSAKSAVEPAGEAATAAETNNQ
jgi:hypothetical protein